MTGAEASHARVFAEEDRHGLDEDQVMVLGELAARVRELIEAAVMTTSNSTRSRRSRPRWPR